MTAAKQNRASDDGRRASGPLPRIDRCLQPRDIAGLVFFRIAMGLVFAAEPVYLYRSGRAEHLYLLPAWFFPYPGLGWIPRLDDAGLMGLLTVLFLCGLAIAAGCCYRLAAALYTLGFGYLHFVDRANYHNHFLLTFLLALLLTIVPAHRAFSVDARMRPSIRSSTAPAWAIALLQFQVGAVYFFSGLAKLRPDWLQGRPGLYLWLAAAAENRSLSGLDPVVMAYVISYGGLLLDLAVVPLLLFRRTRSVGFLLAVGFHLSNAVLLRSEYVHVWLFPWLMIPATTIFLAPDWPRALIRRFRRSPGPPGTTASLGMTPSSAVAGSPLRRLALPVFLSAYGFIQVALPLRHLLYPGPVSWNEEGRRGAWMMMLDVKHASLRFEITDPRTGGKILHDPQTRLSSSQLRALGADPSLILQYARDLARRMEEQGRPGCEVRAVSRVGLNGRAPQPLVDPALDLARVGAPWGHHPWVIPLKEPLPPIREALEQALADHARFAAR